MKILLELNADEMERIFSQRAISRLRRYRFQACGDDGEVCEYGDGSMGVAFTCSDPDDVDMVEAMMEAFARLARESKEVH